MGLIVLKIKQIIKNMLPDCIMDFQFSMKAYKKKHGVFPNIINPKTFNEKVLYRKLFDRRELLTKLADKYAVRNYVGKKLGPSILPKLYFVTDNPADIPFAELPPKFVVKPTHGSGWVLVVTDKSKISHADLTNKCNAWLGQSYYKIGREWVYKNIEPRIIIEEFIDDGSDYTPNDYKLFVFQGRVELIQVDVGRFIEHKRNLYDSSWIKIDASLEFPNFYEELKPPKYLKEMLKAAQMLGEGLDFIRADFYHTENKIYFGEITTTPGNALDRFIPREFDYQLGKLWKQKCQSIRWQ